MQKLYDITKGQLITLWVASLFFWLFSIGGADEGSSFFGFLSILIPTFLIFFTIGWKRAHKKNIDVQDNNLNRIIIKIFNLFKNYKKFILISFTTITLGLVGIIYYINIPRPVNGYMGIEFGMTPLEVKLKLGKPSIEEFSDNKDPTNPQDLIYIYSKTYSYSATYIRFFNDSGEFKAGIICKNSPDYGDELVGIENFDNEADIVKKLGLPTHVSIRYDGLAKVISYEDLKVGFELEKDSVTEMCATFRGSLNYNKEYSSP